jgi:hypothetical protein
MARTISEIYNAIVTEKASMDNIKTALQPEIDSTATLIADLNSESKVAVWRLMYYVFAVAVWIHEVLWDEFKAEVEIIKNSFIPGTAGWLKEEALKFQYGDNMVLQNGKYVYATTNTTTQIVKYCSITEGGMVVIKAAKAENNLPVALLPAELASFAYYMMTYKRFAGVQMSVLSADPDLIRIYADIYYNPLFEIEDVTASVETQINSYLANLPFNGMFSTISVVDYIQLATGFRDIQINKLEAKDQINNWIEFQRIYSPYSGYFKIDTDNPLSITINYIPYV